MLDILVITAPIYLCMLAGYVLTRGGLFTRAGIDALGTFVMYVAMPAVIFLSMSSRRLADVAHPTYLVAYAVTSLLALGVGYVWSRRVNRTPRAAAAFDGMGSGGANSGFVGFPLLLVVLPSVAGGVFGMNVIVESLVTIPLCLFLAERGNAGGGLWTSVRPALVAMAKMPVLLAMAAGLLASASGLVLPDVLRTSVDLLGRASTGLALFTVGGMLVGLSVRGRLGRVLAVSVGKLFLMPAVAFGVGLGLVSLGLPALEGDLFAALVLSAAMPAWTSLSVFAARYGDNDVPPAVLLVTTATSFLTLSGLLAVLT